MKAASRVAHSATGLAASALMLAGCAGGASPSPFGTVAPTATHAAATEKVLYSFGGGTDGGDPTGSVVFDAAGNLYGAAHFGGITTCGGNYGGGCGVVFELSPKGSSWNETALYAFGDGTDGGFPNAGPILDKHGHLYGTASTGGSSSCSLGCGLVYELRASRGGKWAEDVLHAFSGSDGQFPNAVLLWSDAGDFYSTTWYGGSSGNGTVFSLTPSGKHWTEHVLHSFAGGSDGESPAGGVVSDAAGNLYGTTYKYDGSNDGVAFELRKPSWKDRLLYTFADNGGGENPYAGLTAGGKGRLYGTAIENGPNDGGVAFELSAGKRHSWTQSVLHAFGASGDGNSPYGGIVADAAGNLYGTTVFGGASNYGTVYELSPGSGGKWSERILYSFTGGNDGGYPSGALALDSSGNLYGTASNGGTGGAGVVFEIRPST